MTDKNKVDKITLTFEQIKYIAEACGVECSVDGYFEPDIEVTIADGIMLIDEDTGAHSKPTKAFWYSDIPEEGAIGLEVMK